MRERALIGLTIMNWVDYNVYQADAHLISKVLACILHLCIDDTKTS